MSYIAADGRRFTGQGAHQRGRLYDKSIHAKNPYQPINNAPGGDRHDHERKLHGAVKEIRLNLETNTARVTHRDGHSWQEVHPDPMRAHEAMKDYIGIPQFPASQHHAKTRAHPYGQGEAERMRREDGREVERQEEE